MARTNAQQKLGKRVKEYRLATSMTQEQLGFTTSLDRTYISGIERGVRNPSIKNLALIAKSLNVKVSDLTQDF